MIGSYEDWKYYTKWMWKNEMDTYVFWVNIHRMYQCCDQIFQLKPNINSNGASIRFIQATEYKEIMVIDI